MGNLSSRGWQWRREKFALVAFGSLFRLHIEISALDSSLMWQVVCWARLFDSLHLLSKLLGRFLLGRLPAQSRQIHYYLEARN